MHNLTLLGLLLILFVSTFFAAFCAAAFVFFPERVRHVFARYSAIMYSCLFIMYMSGTFYIYYEKAYGGLVW